MQKTQIIKAKTANEGKIYIEATSLGGEKDVAFGLPNIEEIYGQIEDITLALGGVLKKSQPTKASIEFGIEIGLEAGKLTALLVKGTGTANLKITLEWSKVDESKVGESKVGESKVGESKVGESKVGESKVGESKVGQT